MTAIVSLPLASRCPFFTLLMDWDDLFSGLQQCLLWISNLQSPLQHECSQTGGVAPFHLDQYHCLREDWRRYSGVAKIRKGEIWAP